nr:uncharacterized protein LOC108130922 [Drosophila bipectinata]
MKVSVDFTFRDDYIMPEERYKQIAKRSRTTIRNKPRNKRIGATKVRVKECIVVPSSPKPVEDPLTTDVEISVNMGIEYYDFPDFGRPLPVASTHEQNRISLENRKKIVVWQKIHQKNLMDVWRKESRKNPPKK